MTEKVSGTPEGKGGGGVEKANNGAEAGGRAKQMIYTCFCGAGNYVEADWTWFSCWKCGNATHGM